MALIKYSFLVLLFITSIKDTSFANQSKKNVFISDSSLHERFIASLLKEYDKKGRWLFLQIDSCTNDSWYEVVHPISIFNAYKKTFTNLNRQLFIEIATSTFSQNEIFGSGGPCDNVHFDEKNTYHVEGHKINMEYYNVLKAIPIKEILKKYFDSQRNIRKKYVQYLYELIAICYTNNIKVISTLNGNAKYEIFKG